jgi:benzoyl-CoA reductase subunit D
METPGSRKQGPSRRETVMTVAGIDVGGKNVHIVITQEGKILAKAMAPSGINKAAAAEKLYDQTLKQARLRREDVSRVVATGGSGKRVTFASGYIPDAAADARGVIKLVPSARTVIDVGAEEGRAIKISAEGKVLGFATNGRCAAGTGTFVDTMARALEIPVEEMARISLDSDRSIPMNAQCAVFGESEVISLIHQKIARKDIARAVHDSIAGRVGSVARIVGLEPDIVIIGGMARNAGFVASLKRDTKVDITIPADPDYVGAIGAADAAAELGQEECGID